MHWTRKTYKDIITIMKKNKAKLNNLPSKPGVYEFLDKKGEILYIGKAKNLRARVRQYFNNQDERPQIPFLMEEVVDFDYIIVNSELESLYLERNLIQKHRPKYNIELKDDKNYAFIEVSYETKIPQIQIVRKLQLNIAREQKTKNYFGPFTSAKKIRDLIFTARKIFGLCAANNIGKPCFYFHLHRCPGVCAGIINLKDYVEHLEKIKSFFAGKTRPIIKQVKKEMKKAASAKKFEKAAKFRDQLRAIEALEIKQNIIINKPVNWDIVGLFANKNIGCVNLFKIRYGKLIGKENFIFTTIHGRGFNENIKIQQNFLETYYTQTNDAPKEIFIPVSVSNSIELDTDTVAKMLQERFNEKILIKTPVRGKIAKLAKLSEINAKEYLKNYLDERTKNTEKIKKGLQELKKVLKLPSIPKRIEGYDISNTQGTNPVGSMVVFENGVPAKSEYRKFKIQTKNTPDDFAMMKEMLARRLEKIKNTELKITKKNEWPTPDLMVIDGGRGQLNAVMEILNSKHGTLNTIPIIGLAKKIEEIFIPNKKNPIILSRDNFALQLLQRLRDEAHRFGITFHRNLRSRQAVKSIFDDIAGIGPKTKKLLKQHFGTVKNIRKTPLNELTKIVGGKLANIIKQNL